MSSCLFCDEVDNTEHTLCACLSLELYRNKACSLLNIQLTKDNLIETMLKTEQNRKVVKELVNKIV